MAQIFNRAASSDNILLLGTREQAVQPFNAPGWTDLRIGMFLSLTQAAANDTPTGLAESFAASGTPNPPDWCWIGVKDSGVNMPFGNPSSFIGFTNAWFGAATSQLVTSDLGIGSAAYYWRAINSFNNQSFIASDANASLIAAQTTLQFHFFQSTDPGNPGPTGYYAVMLGFRLTRANANSNTVTIQVPHPAANSVDMLWTNAPTQANLLAQLQSFPATVVTLGPINFSVVPNALFCYWPFFLSRLRISAWGIVRAA